MESPIITNQKVYNELFNELEPYTNKVVSTRLFLINQNNFYKSTFSITKKKRIIYVPNNRNVLFKLEPSNSFTQNFFCYPIQENIMADSKFILPYFELFYAFKKFNLIMSQVQNQLDKAYHFYPTILEESKSFQNKLFFIWVFTRFVLLIRKEDPSFHFNTENYYLIVKAFSEVLKKKPNYFYKMISSYTNSIQQLEKLKQKKQSSISQYRRAYCQICAKYLCRVHFYNESQEMVFHDMRVVRTCPKKMSGDRKYIYHLTQSEWDNDIKNNIKCKDELKLCKWNQPITINHDYIEENHFEIFKSINKADFYILNCILSSRITSEACNMRRIFNYKYSCFALEKIIKLCLDGQNNSEVNNYLEFNKKGQVALPIMSLERRITVNYEDALMLDSLNERSISQLPKGKKRMDYIPCEHSGKCSTSNCLCFTTRGYCEKFCMCFKKGCTKIHPGCNCTDGCPIINESEEKAKCICIQEQRECDPEICKHCIKCFNTGVANKRRKKTTVCHSSLINSAGLFANEDIEKFELIDEYLGEIILKDEFERRSILDKKFERSYGFELTEVFDIDALRAGNELRYINHGDFGNDNCFASSRFVRGENKIVLYAKEKIKKGDELFFNYNMRNCNWILKYNKSYGNIE